MFALVNFGEQTLYNAKVTNGYFTQWELFSSDVVKVQSMSNSALGVF